MCCTPVYTWCWERLKAGGEGDDRGLDGWMASPTWWTWVWVSSGIWWWTGKPGMLQSMGSQSRTWLSDWTKLNWNELCSLHLCLFYIWSTLLMPWFWGCFWLPSEKLVQPSLFQGGLAGSLVSLSCELSSELFFHQHVPPRSEVLKPWPVIHSTFGA